MYRVWKHRLLNRVLKDEALSANRGRFLLMALGLGFLTLLTMPIAVLSFNSASIPSLLIYVSALGPVLGVMVYRRTQHFESAASITMLSMVGLIAGVASATGGSSSPVLLAMVLLIMESVLCRSRILLGLAVGSFAIVYTGLGFVPAHATVDNWLIVASLVAVAAYTLVACLGELGKEHDNKSMSATMDDHQLILENLDALIIKHDADGAVSYVSPSVVNIFGVEKGSLVGRGLFDRIHIGDKPAYAKLISDVAALEQTLTAELRIRVDNIGCGGEDNSALSLNHHFCWFEISCRPVFDNNQNVSAIVSSTRNIRHRKEQQQALQEAHERLQLNNNAKTRFLANMSHELRTPLNAIIGFSEILEQDLFGKLANDKQYEYVRLIRESGSHLLQVVTDVLDMSKIESGTFDILPEPFEVSGIVKTCTDILSQEAANRGIELKTVIPQSMPEAVADPRALRQILINLISNALKFSNKDSVVTIGVRVEGDNLAYFVRDRGIGISEQDLERLGEPFFQADSALDRRYEGTGLGVSVVKGLAELHGGRVEFESKIENGTCVTVWMPLDCEEARENLAILEMKADGAKDEASQNTVQGLGGGQTKIAVGL